jgi:hypothetical protein
MTDYVSLRVEWMTDAYTSRAGNLKVTKVWGSATGAIRFIGLHHLKAHDT